MPRAFASDGRLQSLAGITFIVLLTILLVGPLWHPQGIPSGNSDLRIHIHRAAAVQHSFEQGVFWPRWVPNVYQGLGAPVFHHYSPGLYWLVAAIHWIGFRLDLAFKIAISCAFFSFVFGCCRMQHWVRLPPLRSLLTSGLTGAAGSLHLCCYLAPSWRRSHTFSQILPRLLPFGLWKPFPAKAKLPVKNKLLTGTS